MEVNVICGSMNQHFDISYICEPLSAFLTMVKDMTAELESGIGGCSGQFCYTVIWEGEPWCATWYLRGHEDQTVDVVLEDNSSGLLKVLLRVRLRLDVLRDAVYKLAKTILQKYGLTDYENKWMGRGFPLRDFVLLHNRVTGEDNSIQGLDRDIQFLQRFLSGLSQPC